MLDDVQTEKRFVLAWQRASHNVVDLGLERPLLVAAAANIMNELRIEIVNRDVRYFLQHHTCAESVTATDFTHIAAVGQHFGNKFVTREEKGETPRIVVPNLIGHQTK